MGGVCYTSTTTTNVCVTCTYTIYQQTCTGRVVTTSQAHLQPVTALAVDPASAFLLSGSDDANIHVWSLIGLLSFSPMSNDPSAKDPHAPIHTLSNHRSPVTALATGHSYTDVNIAVSTSRDNTAIVWDYHNGNALRTYLLGDTPLALALDPADRAFYTTYEDGTVQVVDFYRSARESAISTLHNASSLLGPIQPSADTRLNAVSQDLGPGLSLAVSWDGMTLLSGHGSGQIAAWSIGRVQFSRTVATLPGPVTNVEFLPPLGFLGVPKPKFKVHAVTKPRFDALSGPGIDLDGTVPGNYTFNAQLVRQLSAPSFSATEPQPTASPGALGESAFEIALTHPSFPITLIEEGLAELANWNQKSTSTAAPEANGDNADYMALDDTSKDRHKRKGAPEILRLDLAEQNELLRQQVASLQRIQAVTFKQLEDLKEEREELLAEQAEVEKRRVRRQVRRARKAREKRNVPGEVVVGHEAKDDEGSEGDEVDSYGESEAEKTQEEDYDSD